MRVAMKRLLIPTAALLLLLGACKPSEKNYRLAYEAARDRERKSNEALGIDAGMLLSVDGAVATAVDGDTIYVQPLTVSVAEVPDSTSMGTGDRGVAIARHSMRANAASQLADLAGRNRGMFLARDGEGRWYVMLGRFSADREALQAIRLFGESNPGYPFVGLPGRPVVVTVK